ncbi:GspB domain-containing protein [Caldichromatium japonicum]|uniref:GspB domain-containing protein n=1 Tax=Caldichromatium japonicum TaxID=2699430 RepID=A0A6G7VGB2_9GAMM|nr:general secretion pathway protein GspB [Caldichromatium japonicum]QIK38905.1 GspB domain-containing protein [Caldichromatium japonicum]
MSYILEALKRSQQERELGRVPSPYAPPLLAKRPAPPPAHHWALLAIGLAALAVVIALYAAFRSPGLWKDAPLVAQQPSAVPQTAPSATQPPASAAVSSPMPPLVEPPPPKPRPVVAEPAPSSAAAPSHPPTPTAPSVPTPTPGSADWEALALRQLEAEQAALNAAREVLQEEPRPASIPKDLVQEIQAFKEQVRREQQGQSSPSARHQPIKIPEDPTRLRLTLEQQAELPAYLMTVHVYDPDPARRFVIINTLRYREGEETREGFRVERILKEGAVLSYRGAPFYVPR